MITKLSRSDYSLKQMFDFIRGTHKIGELSNVTYKNLNKAFGEPSILHFENAKSDKKIQVEWIFEYNSKHFTIYDWKTFDTDYTLEKLKRWSIGGSSEDKDFVKAVKSRLDSK